MPHSPPSQPVGTRPQLETSKSFDDSRRRNVYTPVPNNPAHLRELQLLDSLKNNPKKLLLAKTCPYYQGDIGRKAAEDRLSTLQQGAYLLRDQSNNEKNFVLSYR